MYATKIPFNSLPASIQESLLWDMELDYDSYESSRAEMIHGIMCGDCNSTNETAIKNYYKALSPDDLRMFIAPAVASAIRTIDGCNLLKSKLDDLINKD